MYMLIPIGLHKDSSHLHDLTGIQRKRFIPVVLAPANYRFKPSCLASAAVEVSNLHILGFET